LGKLFTPMCLCHRAAWLGTGRRSLTFFGWEGILAENNGSLPPEDDLQVTCELTACTPGSAPGPPLGNEYGITLPLPTGCVPVCRRSWCQVELRTVYSDDCCHVFRHLPHCRSTVAHWLDGFICCFFLTPTSRLVL